MARRLSVFTELTKYAVPDPTRWRTYRYQDLNLYANPYVEALNVGDPDGLAYDAIARRRSPVDPALIDFGEDGAAEASIGAALATLDLADSTLRTGTDQNGRLRSSGKREMRAVDALERDAVDPSPTQSATAVLDKVAAAVLLENRNRQARVQFISAIVEQLLVANKRERDTDAAAMNMQLGRLRDGRSAEFSLIAGSGDDLRTWKQP
jgi:hypothetical protein